MTIHSCKPALLEVIRFEGSAGKFVRIDGETWVWLDNMKTIVLTSPEAHEAAFQKHLKAMNVFRADGCPSNR